LTPPLAISSSKLLVVEGQDEERLFSEALAAWGVDAQILPIGGKTKLGANLKTLRNDTRYPGVSTIAVLRDADDDAQAALRSVRGALSGAGLTPPGEHGRFSTGTPRVGIYVLPDGATPGMLETVCLQSADARLVACADAYFNCAKLAGAQISAEMDKARVHAWLATRPRPDLRLGEAAAAGYLDFSGAAFANLCRFCRQI
jgi:hypothetical protein